MKLTVLFVLDHTTPSQPFSFSNPQLLQPGGIHQLPSVNQRGGFQFAPITPQNTAFNFTQMSHGNSSTVINFGQPGASMTFNVSWNNNAGNNNASSSNSNSGGFDPNSLHDVD